MTRARFANRAVGEKSSHPPSPAVEDPAVFVVGAGEGRGEGLNSKAFKILFLL